MTRYPASDIETADIGIGEDIAVRVDQSDIETLERHHARKPPDQVISQGLKISLGNHGFLGNPSHAWPSRYRVEKTAPGEFPRPR